MQEGKLQQIMKEQGWVTVETLIREAEENAPVIVQAFKTLNELAWSQFIDDLWDNSALRYYNTEDARFSHAQNWHALAAQEGLGLGGLPGIASMAVKVTRQQLTASARGKPIKDLTLSDFSIAPELLKYAEAIYYDDESGFLRRLTAKNKQGPDAPAE